VPVEPQKLAELLLSRKNKKILTNKIVILAPMNIENENINKGIFIRKYWNLDDIMKKISIATKL